MRQPEPSWRCSRRREDRLSSTSEQSASLQSSITTRVIQEVFSCTVGKLTEVPEKKLVCSVATAEGARL